MDELIAQDVDAGRKDESKCMLMQIKGSQQTTSNPSVPLSVNTKKQFETIISLFLQYASLTCSKVVRSGHGLNPSFGLPKFLAQREAKQSRTRVRFLVSGAAAVSW